MSKGIEAQGQARAEPQEDPGVTVPRAALALLQAAASEEEVLGEDEAAGRLLDEVGGCIDTAPALLRATARRLAVVDLLCRRFLARTPGGLVVSVGSLLGTRAQRVGRGRWLDVDPPAVAALRRDTLGRRPGYRQLGASLTEPASWLRSLGRRGRPLLVILEEPLLALPDPALDALLDGLAAHLPEGTEVVAPTDRRWALGTLEQHGNRPVLVRCNHTLSYWPRLQRDELPPGEEALAAALEETRRAAFLLRCRWVPSLLHLRMA